MAANVEAYSYINVYEWSSIIDGPSKGKGEYGKPGLSIHHGIERVDPEERGTYSVMVFLHPQPSEWVDNPHFKDAWSRVKRRSGHLLLATEVDSEDGTLYVADRGSIEGYLSEDKTGIPQKYLHSTLEEAEQHYRDNQIPLSDYLRDSREFSLPHLLFTRRDKLDKLSISPQQPLLTEMLDSCSDALRANLLNKYTLLTGIIPELKSWFTSYEDGMGELPQETPTISYYEKLKQKNNSSIPKR